MQNYISKVTIDNVTLQFNLLYSYVKLLTMCSIDSNLNVLQLEHIKTLKHSKIKCSNERKLLLNKACCNIPLILVKAL